MKLHKILKRFASHDILRYSYHHFDPNMTVYMDKTYDSFVSNAKKAWEKEFDDLRELNPHIWNTINNFIFGGTWGRYNIEIGWSHEGLIKYAQPSINGKYINYHFNYELPHIYNIDSIEMDERKKVVRFSDLIQIFQGHFELGHSPRNSLRNLINRTTRIILPKSEGYVVRYDELEAYMYTNTSQLYEILCSIFNAMVSNINIVHIYLEYNDGYILNIEQESIKVTDIELYNICEMITFENKIQLIF